MVWKPHVTVAAVIEKDRRFLLVEEETKRGIRFNQPAGHLEEGESLTAAVKREVYEETGWQFEPEHIIAVQLWRRNPNSASFLRMCFAGRCHSFNPEHELDDGIISAHWLTRDEIAGEPERLRSPLVLLSVDEYLQGRFHSLDLIKSFIDLDHE
ncbi:MAG: NUDIX hydrolase [Gammaproteobacteria bacterium]